VLSLFIDLSITVELVTIMKIEHLYRLIEKIILICVKKVNYIENIKHKHIYVNIFIVISF